MSDTGGGAPAVPTGCYKCGRPGHWSRDCPSSNPNPNPNPSNEYPKPSSSSFPPSTTFSKGSFHPKASTAAPKPKKAPRTRPKVTPELLLSHEGLGYILRYFPRNFKYRGRGHEANDLRNLLRMYAEWHSQFLPYFPFDQFIHKVEEAGSSKRVKTCIAELKERVAKGGDPTKLKESMTENEIVYDKEDVFNSEEPTHPQEDLAFNENVAEDMQEDILNEIYNKTVEETYSTVQAKDDSADMPPGDSSMKNIDSEGRSSNSVKVTEELKALMEAKRLKALERAAARSRLRPAS